MRSIPRAVAIPARRRAAGIGMAALLGAFVAPASIAPALPVLAADGCDLTSQTWTIDAAIDQPLTTAFAAYGDQRKAWTGGDSTYSVPLSADRRAWLFSDTLYGPVNGDGTQPLDTTFVNSSIVVEKDGTPLKTVTGGTGSDPTGLIAPSGDSWYWLGAGLLRDDGSSVDVVFMRFERFGPGQWDWGWKENVLGRLDPHALKVRETVPLPSASGVNWASWLSRSGDHTLIYGVEDLGLTKYMHIARVAGDDLAGPWEFWTGSGWSDSETDSVRVTDGVANEYSVTPYRDGYLLVTQDTLELFSRNIVGYVSCSPTGPFTRIGTLYSTPETGLFGSYGNPNVFTYNAHEHPELRDGNRLLVTYNVNSFDPNDLYADATIYRPRFVDVMLTPGS